MTKTKWMLIFSLLFSAACESRLKESSANAPFALEFLVPLVERDTTQIRKGLPEGAAVLGKLIDDDPKHDPEGLRRSIEKARGAVTDLAIAKSTFFIFVSPDGTVLRSEAEPDLAVGGSIFSEIPDSKRIFEKPGMVEVFGSMHGLRGVQNGADLQWVVGQQVAVPSGKVVGAYVTGWSFRKYADFLEGALRRNLTDNAKNKKGAAPLVYVFFARGSKAYGGAVTPDIDAEAVGKLDLPTQVGDRLFQSTLTIEEQSFALVAKKVPAIDKDTVLVLLFSAL